MENFTVTLDPDPILISYPALLEQINSVLGGFTTLPIGSIFILGLSIVKGSIFWFKNVPPPF